MSATNYLETKLLDHVLRNTPFPQPTGLFVSLHTANPGEVGTGSEVIGGSYVRQAIDFADAVGPDCAHAGTVTFAGMPAVTVTHFGIQDAVTSGNPLFNGPLTTPQTVPAGATLKFDPGTLVVSCD